MFDSLVRVSRRVIDHHYASILAERGPRSRPGYYAAGYNTPRGESHSQSLYPPAKIDAGLGLAKCTGENTG